jgi:hypothetical protein
MAFRVVVTGFIGTGTSRDPFRADVANPGDVRLSIIDLSDLTSHDLCVAILDYGDGTPSQPATRVDGTTAGAFWDLGDDPFSGLTGARRTQLANRLGITIPTNATIGVVALLKLGARLQASSDRMLRIRCGRLVLHEQLAVAGGATDPFTYSDGALQTVSSAVWARHTDSPAIGGTISVASNIVTVGGSSDGADRYDSDLGSAAHFAQLDVTISGTATGNDVMAGPITRMGTTSTDVSGFVALAGANTNADRFMLTRVDSGSFTTLDSDTTSSGTYELRLESDGSSQILFINGVNTLSATDSAHSANTYTGIYIYKYGAYVATGDNFENGVLGNATVTPGAIAVSTSIPQATATTSNPFVTQVKVAAVTATRSPSFTLDTSPLENDVIYCWVSSTTAAAITDTSGWTNVLGANTDVESDAHEMLCVYHKVTAAEDTANTVTWTLTNIYDANETGDLVAVVVRQVDPADALAGVNSTFSSTNTVTPAVLASVTPDASGGLILSGVVQDSTGTYTQPTNWTVRATSNTNQALSAFSYDLGATSGVGVGPTDITPDAGDEYISITIVAKAVPSSFGGTAEPAAIAAPVTIPAATGHAPATVTPAAISAPTTIPQATPLAGAVPTPAAIAAPVTVPQATPLASSTTTPAATAVTVTVPAATRQGGGDAAPAAIAAPVTLPAATPLASSTPTPAAIAVTVVIPAATASESGTNATAEPAAIAAPVTVPAVTTQAGAAPTPAAIAATSTVPQATPLASSTPTPAAIAATTAIGQATPLASSTPTPAVIAVVASPLAAAASGSDAGTGTPAAITATATVPAVTAQASHTATPAATAVPITVPQATGHAPATVTPAAIAATAALGAVIAQAGSVVTPAVITAAATLPAPVIVAGATATPAAIALAFDLGVVVVTDGSIAEHALTATVRDQGHTATVDDNRQHTATIRDQGHTATAREQR